MTWVLFSGNKISLNNLMAILPSHQIFFGQKNLRSWIAGRRSQVAGFSQKPTVMDRRSQDGCL